MENLRQCTEEVQAKFGFVCLGAPSYAFLHTHLPAAPKSHYEAR